MDKPREWVPLCKVESADDVADYNWKRDEDRKRNEDKRNENRKRNEDKRNDWRNDNVAK